MSIDQIVPLVEQIVAAQKEGRPDSFFSYRHAEELHALGVKREFVSGHPWSQVCISIVISAVTTPKIWVRILWSRSTAEYPPEDYPPWEFPLSEAGVRLFEKEWPAILDRFQQAVIRGHPPEAPNSERSAASERGVH